MLSWVRVLDWYGGGRVVWVVGLWGGTVLWWEAGRVVGCYGDVVVGCG